MDSHAREMDKNLAEHSLGSHAFMFPLLPKAKGTPGGSWCFGFVLLFETWSPNVAQAPPETTILLLIHLLSADYRHTPLNWVFP